MKEPSHIERYKIEPQKQIDLNDYDPDDITGFEGKDEAEKQESKKLNDKLGQLQEKLYAEHQAKLLIVLQAMDTGGKDGVIHRVFQGVNPQGVRVAHFVEPTPEELNHDFLWRVHKQVPGKSEIVIFNRSHYESVLVERVHKIVPKKVWKRRYGEINDFERLLTDDGTIIVKFFLHIDKDEQKKRLQERLDDPFKEWKFSIKDLPERKYWDEYMSAYEDAMAKTSTKSAPWYVIPANHKWYRDLVVSRIIVKTLVDADLTYPKMKQNPKNVIIK